ncbi:MAG: CHAT domain-containing tetratricopeptide repeat protein [Candidatus Aminicenantales bacterium]
MIQIKKAAQFLIFIYSLTPLFPSEKNPLSNFEKQYFDLIKKGEECRIEGNFDESQGFFEKSLALARKNKSEAPEIEPLLKLSLLSWNMGHLKESADYNSKALSLARKCELKKSEEFCLQALAIYKLYNEAKEFRSSGEYQKSLDSFARAIDLARKINSQEHELKCLRQMSLTYWEMNNFPEFYRLNKKALDIAETLNHTREKGNCLNNLGLYYWKIDNYSNALTHYENALEIAEKLKNVEGEAECLNNIGLIYREMGNYDKALVYINRALEIDQKYFGKDYISIGLNNIGTIYRNKGLLLNSIEDLYKALDYFYNCLQIVKKIKNQKIEIRVLNNIGNIYSDLENYSEALKHYQKALKAAEDIRDDEAKSMILNNIGIVHYNLGNYEESTNSFQKAIDLALEFKGGQVLWEAYLEIANVYKKQNRLPEALKNYKNSISVIESTRSTIELEEYRASYLGTDKRIEAYHNLIDVLLRLHESRTEDAYDAEAFNYLEKAKARAFLDSLEVAEVNISQGVNIKLINEEKQVMREISGLYRKLLSPELTPQQKLDINEGIKNCEDQLEKLKSEIRTTSPAYANLKYPEIIHLSEAQKMLDAHTAFFAFSIGKESSYAFVVARNTLQVFPIPPRKEIQTKISEYLRIISDKESSDFRPGYELYEELFLPGLNKKIKKIIFIPDDILYFLPFETLLTRKEKGSWLINDYTVAYAPSISSLRQIITRRNLQKARPQKDLLAFGDPFYKINGTAGEEVATDIFQNIYSTSAFHFFRLTYSGLEVEKIAAHFKKKKTDLFLREKATEDELKRSPLANYKILHFATHGLIDEKKPARSALVLSLNPDSTEDGFVQMRELYNLRINSDLVTLSACQTGLGKFIRGEGIEGLNRAFFYAGASSVLMSLWAVNDEASAQLMDRFYYHLHSSESIMSALRRAKLELIHSPPLSHPYYWAGFVITGNADKTVYAHNFNRWMVWIISLCLAGIIMIGVKFSKKNKRLP